jgi:hypothetical protein
MWISTKERSEGWEGGWWERFVNWFRRVTRDSELTYGVTGSGGGCIVYLKSREGHSEWIYVRIRTGLGILTLGDFINETPLIPAHSFSRRMVGGDRVTIHQTISAVLRICW